MKKHLRSLVALLAALALLTAAPAYAFEEPVDEFDDDLEDDIFAIEIISVTVDEPAIGARPAAFATVTTVPEGALSVTSVPVTWYRGDLTALADGDTFEADTEYRAVPDLDGLLDSVNEGFIVVDATQVTVNGGDAANFPMMHDWDEPAYVWAKDNGAVTATRVCKSDPDHVETETADSVYTVVKAPTESEAGEATYTAAFQNPAFEQQTKTVVLDKLPPSITFVDVVKGAYYEQAVAWAVANGVTAGTSPTTFSPNNYCTRGQVVTFLWRAAGSPAPANTAHPFTDVREDAFYYKAMLWAVENGVTNGMSATTFAPNRTCTRAQVVTFLYRSK